MKTIRSIVDLAALLPRAYLGVLGPKSRTLGGLRSPAGLDLGGRAAPIHEPAEETEAVA